VVKKNNFFNQIQLDMCQPTIGSNQDDKINSNKIKVSIKKA